MPPDECPVQLNDNLGRTMIEMARAGLDVHARMAEALNLSRSRLEDILATDHGLALVCKRLGLSRIAFSTLAMLDGPQNRQRRNAMPCSIATTAVTSQAGGNSARGRAMAV